MRFLLIKSHYLALLRLIIPMGDYNWQKSSNAFSQLKDIGIPDLGIRFKRTF
jgi:hypothetical protein